MKNILWLDDCFTQSRRWLIEDFVDILDTTNTNIIETPTINEFKLKLNNDLPINGLILDIMLDKQHAGFDFSALGDQSISYNPVFAGLDIARILMTGNLIKNINEIPIMLLTNETDSVNDPFYDRYKTLLVNENILIASKGQSKITDIMNDWLTKTNESTYCRLSLETHGVSDND